MTYRDGLDGGLEGADQTEHSRLEWNGKVSCERITNEELNHHSSVKYEPVRKEPPSST